MGDTVKKITPVLLLDYHILSISWYTVLLTGLALREHVKYPPKGTFLSTKVNKHPNKIDFTGCGKALAIQHLNCLNEITENNLSLQCRQRERQKNSRQLERVSNGL